MFGTHMMPRAVHAFLVANSSRHFDVRILESRELSDGIRLLQHNAIDCLIECTDSKLEFENLKATPLPCSFEHVFLVHQGRFPEIANRPGEFLSLTELSEVPIAHAITRVLSPILYLSGITRLELPTFEAVRRHAEQGDAIGLMFNWAPSLGIPDGLTTAEEMRRHLLKWQLVPKFVSPEGKDHLMKKVMRTYMVTSTLDVVTSSMQRLLKEVSQQCEHIQRNQRLLPQTYTPNKSRATPKRRASKHQ